MEPSQGKDPVLDLAQSEDVKPPDAKPAAPMCRKSVTIIAASTGIGKAVWGYPGAVAGAAIGWTVDAIRRRLIA